MLQLLPILGKHGSMHEVRQHGRLRERRSKECSVSATRCCMRSMLGLNGHIIRVFNLGLSSLPIDDHDQTRFWSNITATSFNVRRLATLRFGTLIASSDAFDSPQFTSAARNALDQVVPRLQIAPARCEPQASSIRRSSPSCRLIVVRQRMLRTSWTFEDCTSPDVRCEGACLAHAVRSCPESHRTIRRDEAACACQNPPSVRGGGHAVRPKNIQGDIVARHASHTAT